MCLIAHPDGQTLDELLQRSGLDVDRSTLFRHLTRLIELRRAERIGKARASRYRPPGVAVIRGDLALPQTQPAAVQSMPGVLERYSPNETPVPSAGEVQQVHLAGRDDARSAENSLQVRAEPVSVPDRALAHDAVVMKAVRTIVRDWKRCNQVNLRIYLSLLVMPEHLDEVAAAVEKELAGLDEDALARFGLSPAELAGFTPPAGSEATGE